MAYHGGHAGRDSGERSGLRGARRPDEAERDGADAAPWPGESLSIAALARLLAEPAPRGHDSAAARGAMMRQAQRTLGNRAAQRLLQGPGRLAPVAPALQRTPSIISVDGEEKELIHRKPDVPGLSKATETTAKPLLAGSATDKQQAIDTVVTDMVKSGEFSLSKIKDKKVKYNSATVGEGLTSSEFKNGKATVSLMEIGDAAFATLGWLYSSLLHEYKHVQQHHALKSTADWDEDYAEVEAYAREIKKAKDTSANKAQMEELWKRLHDGYWVNITDAKKKKKLKALVKASHKIAEKATGKKLTLTL